MIELALYIVAFCIVACAAFWVLVIFAEIMHFVYSLGKFAVTGRR